MYMYDHMLFWVSGPRTGLGRFPVVSGLVMTGIGRIKTELGLEIFSDLVEIFSKSVKVHVLWVKT